MSDTLLKSLSVIKQPLGRRTFMMTGLAAGFAAAAEPVMAQAIITSAEGLSVAEVKVPVDGGTIPAYTAMPAQGGPFATVIVVHEIFGVHEHIKDICRRLAKLGYYAIAPELFARQGDPSKYKDIASLIEDVVSKTPDAEVAGDLDATLAFAKTQPKADTARLGMVGFCWGGRQTWLYTEHNPAVKAAVAMYGPLGDGPDPLEPNQVIDGAQKITTPVLGLYGALDQGIPQSKVEALRAKLDKGKSGSKIHVYPDTGHAFFADYRSSYNKADAADAWKRLQAWYKANGVS
ncbi:MAG: dienelactone hydrolase family protein [Hyphomicrobiales bacterium]|nr:dienelactone hydrolase family protein [Hyphomicrobiales bacterium]MDE2115459.1 dienelactone hydrolase family protein [Hyphomicrobiales bacterium]